jgi:hypothetical protein
VLHSLGREFAPCDANHQNVPGLVDKGVRSIREPRVMFKMKARSVPELVQFAIRVVVPTRFTFDGGEMRAGELAGSLSKTHLPVHGKPSWTRVSR